MSSRCFYCINAESIVHLPVTYIGRFGIRTRLAEKGESHTSESGSMTSSFFVTSNMNQFGMSYGNICIIKIYIYIVYKGFG